ncbi:MAG: hypothetical protein WBM17_03370 [Anaerolineales bacterium]
MERESLVRLAVVAGLVLLAAVICVAVGAPMIDMIRAHLGI